MCVVQFFQREPCNECSILSLFGCRQITCYANLFNPSEQKDSRSSELNAQNGASLSAYLLESLHESTGPLPHYALCIFIRRERIMDALTGLLPIALLLACPAMMIFCFWGMRRGSCSTESQPATDAAPAQALSAAEQARLLQIRLEHLQTEQAAIATQLAQLLSSDQTTRIEPAGPEQGSVALEGGRA
jgi:hypothetical protein